MYNINSFGPKIEPCGTSQVTLNNVDRAFLLLGCSKNALGSFLVLVNVNVNVNLFIPTRNNYIVQCILWITNC